MAATSKDSAQPRLRNLAQVDASGRHLVDIIGNMSQIDGRIAALGGSAVKVRGNSARAWMPLDKVEQLAADPSVKSIREAHLAMTQRIDPPGQPKWRTGTREERVAAVQAAQDSWSESLATPAQTSAVGGPVTNVGARTSEGDHAHGADRARRFFGVDGTGVKIGVLSDSDDFKEQSIATGDLPAGTTTVPGEDGRPGSGEGTAIMQIVHDVAPGAELFFATAFNGPESFADNIRTLRFVYHCDIILDDIIYLFESAYQDDIIAQAVNDVTNDGAMYFASAGNEGNFDDGTSGTWEGDFRASGALATLPSGYTVHTFGSQVISNRIEVGGEALLLNWSDPGTLLNPASSNDYDLFLLDNNLNVVLASTDIQDGDDLPLEGFAFEIPAGFRVVVAATPGAQVRAIRTIIFRGEFGISTPGATWGHNSTVDGFGVAAVDALEAGDGEFPPGPTTPAELFSSDGPRRIFYRPDNTPINADRPGVTFASGGGSGRAKPDITAADGVSTTLPPGSGLNPFFGTSAAAPHVAAIAGLVKSALPTRTAAQIRSVLLAGATDIESPGVDRNTGRGIVSAFQSLLRAGARAAVSLAAGAITVRPLGTDVVVPGGAAQVNIELTNGGGAPATAVTSTLTSTSNDVLILQGSSPYPNIPAEGSATNTAPFAFFVNPTALCGSLLPFTLTVNYTGNGPRPFVVNFLVRLGRPSPTPAHFAFNGAVAIPDASAAGVNVPFAVSFPGGIAKVVFNIDGTSCNSTEGSTTVGVDHTWVGDLAFKLTSPSGASATLFSRPGGNGNSGNNLCRTKLEDGAENSIQNVTIAQAPFTGTFSPAQPLSVFAGQNGNGTWTLNAADLALFDLGTIRAVSLDVSGFTCGP